MCGWQAHSVLFALCRPLLALFQELVALHDGIRALVVPDDNEFKQLSAASQQALLPKEPAFVPEPEPEYESEWEEDAAGLATVEVKVPVSTVRGPYSDF